MRKRRRPNGRPALPSDDRYWHLDWYGGVRRVPGGRTRVELVLSPVAPKDVPPLGSAPIEGRDFIKPGGQRVVPVSLDLFARSPIGSLFLNRQAVDPIRYLEYSPSDLEFSPEALRSVQTAVALADDSGRPLYPVCGHGEGWCLAIRLGDDDMHVVIPALEVLRFYYGTSSALLDALLSHNFEEAFSLICDPARSGPDGEDDQLTVCLRPSMAKGDTQLAAALVTSDIARACARRIFPSLISSYRLVGTAYPKAYPPFVGQAKLRLSGFWLGPPNRRRFLGLEIQLAGLPVRAQVIARIRDPRRSRGAGAAHAVSAPSAAFVRVPPTQRRRFADELPILEPKGPGSFVEEGPGARENPTLSGLRGSFLR